MTADEYPSGSINTKGMQAGTFLRNRHHYNGRHPLSPLLFFDLILIPPSLLQSIILWSPCLFFLSGLRPAFCLPSLTLWPARHPFTPELPPFLSPLLLPTPPEKAVSSPLSICLFFFFSLCGCCTFPCRGMRVCGSPGETLKGLC